jgi:hypothetical protein
MHSTLRRAWVCALAPLVIGACGDSTAPEVERTETDLHFVRLSASAPPLSSTVVTLWAKRGTDREVRVGYQGFSEDYVRLRVGKDALSQRPDGSTIAMGDSVLITMTVIDPTKFIVQFQPAGLRFSSSSPARLQFEFNRANHDLDGNGVIDANDTSLRTQLAIWRQEAPGLPWVKLSSKVEAEADEVSADLLGFSGYALAY